MARRSIGGPVGFWLTVCAGLAAVVAYQVSSSYPLAPTVTAAPPSTVALDLAERPAPPRLPADDAVDLITARPLFSESRRPYEPPPAPVEAVIPETSAPGLPLELAGTYLTGTDQAALLMVAGGAPTWLRKGEQIEGWQIEVIAHDRVELRREGRHQVLQLRDDIAVSKTTQGRQAAGDDATRRPLAGAPADEDEDEDEYENGEEDETTPE